ncbi:MAG TPA: SIS domain-containing protein [Planctomycetota bacterium]|nr:SIS domain-containing protein [Planctomycetota bacterium]
MSTTNRHVQAMVERCPALDGCSGDVERAFRALARCFAAGRKMLLCGNGGSAADCEHFAGELLKGFKLKRPLAAAARRRLAPELGENLQGALPAIPLTGFPAFSTAFANDVDPHLIFAQLVWALGQPGDVLLGISTSGNALNVRRAAEAARARRMTVIALTGRTGGELRRLADVCIRTPGADTAEVQQHHLPVYHALSLMLEDEFFG